MKYVYVPDSLCKDIDTNSRENGRIWAGKSHLIDVDDRTLQARYCAFYQVLSLGTLHHEITVMEKN